MFKSGFWFNFSGTLASVLWKLCLILDSVLYFLVLCTCNVLQMWSLLLSIAQNKWQIKDSHSQQLFLKLWEGFMVTKSCKFSIASTFFPKNPIIYLSSNRKIPSSFFQASKWLYFFCDLIGQMMCLLQLHWLFKLVRFKTQNGAI